jgi:predicted kinase
MNATARPGDAAATSSLYAASMTAAVYQRLASLARSLLAAGRSVVVDAACNAALQREMFAAVARERDVPLVWLDFDIPAADLLARVAQRQAHGCDASDATVDVVRMQLETREPLTADELARTPRARWLRITCRELADPQQLALQADVLGS